jgi:hypothetical protein
LTVIDGAHAPAITVASRTLLRKARPSLIDRSQDFTYLASTLGLRTLPNWMSNPRSTVQVFHASDLVL